MGHVILDTSSNNGRVNFGALRQAHPELSGVIVKATEGSGYVNPLFGQQIAAARAAGLYVGAYGFMHPSVAGTGDDSLFERVAGLGALPLGMWLDCEVTDGLDPATISARFAEDAAEFDRHYKGHDGIYTGRWFWDPQTRGSGWASSLPLWISGYVSAFNPSLIPYPWTSCLLWQFTDNWNGTGIDASVFMGDDAAWGRWVGQTGPPPPPPNANRFANEPTLRMGCPAGQPVIDLQNALNITLGFEAKDNPNRLTPDGQFGPATNHHVGFYQQTHGLGVDFVVGPHTWASLDAALDAKHR